MEGSIVQNEYMGLRDGFGLLPCLLGLIKHAL